MSSDTISISSMTKKSNTAIILAVSGSAALSATDTYNNIKHSFETAFPDNPVNFAYTSEMIIEKMRAKGNSVLNVEESIREFTEKGYTSIILQSLHIMPGEEYLSLMTNNTSGHIFIGKPLLSTDDDIQHVAEIIAPFCKSSVPTVIAAHGNGNIAELNSPLFKIASIINKQTDNAALCTLEGAPGTEPMKRIMDYAKNIDSVNILPFMLVSGVHVQRDLIGADPLSWKNILGVSNVTIYPPLGEMQEIRDLFISHCKVALAKADNK